jgi:hypothetical protein
MAARALPTGGSFAFGESPFHVKGVLYLGTQSFFESNMKGGVATFAADIADSELRAFITQKFLPSSWYDVMPVPALIAAEARALRMPLEAYLLHRTRWQAKKDLGGVHGWVLKVASPELVVERLPRVFVQMFDFASIESSSVEMRHAKMDLKGVPQPLVPWLETALGVYADTALKLAGAKKVESAFAAEPVSERAGVPIVKIRLEVAWS